MSNTTKTGNIAGTGAALKVNLGFVPDYVEVFNFSDAGSLWPTMKWFKGMAAASALKGLKTVDSGATGNASQALVLVNGISTYSDSTGAGFIIGADADINVNGETVAYHAARNLDGA